MTHFNGWSQDLVRFFEGLEHDNSKEYFDANRDVYQTAVREPTEAFMAAVGPCYGPGHMFRLNRDVRFSKDKRPYHTNLGVAFSVAGSHYYASVSARELLVSVGVFRADKTWVDRFRAAVDGRPGDDLLAVLGDLEERGFTIGGATLKTAPRGYPADHRNARLLRHRALTATRALPPKEWVDNTDALTAITETWTEAESLATWLRTHCPATD